MGLQLGQEALWPMIRQAWGQPHGSHVWACVLSLSPAASWADSESHVSVWENYKVLFLFLEVLETLLSDPMGRDNHTF